MLTIIIYNPSIREIDMQSPKCRSIDIFGSKSNKREVMVDFGSLADIDDD